MNIEILTNQIAELFRTNLEEFFENRDSSCLTEELSLKMILQTRDLVRKIGIITLEQFFESYDIEIPTLQIDGTLYRFKYKGPRDFMTSVGKIKLYRSVYQKDKGGKTVVPLDRMWNMEHEYLSAEMKEGVLYSSAHNTPEETSKLMAKFGLTNVHASTIKKVISQVGHMVASHKEQIIEGIYEQESLPQRADIMSVSLDGVNVLLNEKEKGKQKRKGRPKERPYLKKGELSGSSYKNAMCGTMSLYNTEYQEDKEVQHPIRLVTKYISRMPEARFTTFKKEFEKEILHGMHSNPKAKILLVDAHLSIQGYIKSNPLFNDFHCLIDFFHACEHLSKLSEWIFGKRSTEGQTWYEQKREVLKSSKAGVDKVIRSAKYYIVKKLTNQTRIRGATSELKYFGKHKKRMKYHEFVEKGWPIGSGVVEAACKSIVKQRMCRSGQRWTTKGGQNILNLRTFVKSNRWDLFYSEISNINFRKCA